MKHAIDSILKVISNARVVMADGKQLAEAGLPMVELDPHELRDVAGGDTNLPKGGW